MAIHLGRLSPAASRDLPGRQAGNRLNAIPIWSCSRWGLPCRRRYRRRGALLPHPFTLTPTKVRAVCFLWHFPWGRPRQALPGTVLPWSPDFPPRLSGAAIRPSDLIHITEYQGVNSTGIHKTNNRRQQKIRFLGNDRTIGLNRPVLVRWLKMPLKCHNNIGGARVITTRDRAIVADYS